MRTANFRDDVLWVIAYKLGLDPATDFLKDQASALASYINAWVRRLCDAADWPEWTALHRFTPANHIISYDALPSDGATTLIGKVLKVYLNDPTLHWGPIDTPFRMYDRGYHVGFDHGPNVWVKYLPRAPKFTATEWDAARTYKKNEVTYLPTTGECYISKANGNKGHNPTQLAEADQPVVVLSTEITQEFAPGNPGMATTAKIMDILAEPSPSGSGSFADPPASATKYYVEIQDVTHAVLGSAQVICDGVMTLDTVFANLTSLLVAVPALSAFTITKLTAPLRIRLEDESDFGIFAVYSEPFVTKPLVVQQIQGYTTATSPAVATPKEITLSMAESEVIPESTYTLTFISLDGAEHPVTYTSLPTDNAEQILNGLADALVALQGADPFFVGIQSTVDPLSPNLKFTIPPTLAKAGLDAVVAAPGSIWWTYVPFPLALVDQVVRGAYADAMREQGQPDKGQPEEQQVATEQGIVVNAFAAKQYNALTDQQVAHSRYSRDAK
jgi:hypothetical protein